jgi:hypothetical protein
MPSKGKEVHPITCYEGRNPIFNLGARWGWVANATPRPLYHRERDAVLIV